MLADDLPGINMEARLERTTGVSLIGTARP
jgi:hypothetical protein